MMRNHGHSDAYLSTVMICAHPKKAWPVLYPKALSGERRTKPKACTQGWPKPYIDGVYSIFGRDFIKYPVMDSVCIYGFD